MPPPSIRISAWRVAGAGSDTATGSLARFWQHETTRTAKIPASKPTNCQIQPHDINISLAVALISMLELNPSDQSAKGEARPDGQRRHIMRKAFLAGHKLTSL